ncbi:hypothetical protein [Allopusillimonas ginsengisoli]|uniref:hypothetical protein n=1 Tax=Allopusillimonas ginsengisoli TaxID=453575 RepID=UPI0010203FE7|nr:hypothetical protein [Allopusillimonas ginsengisoli]TEA78651.1 hypothetical protein ERE07_09655 [Allopusillimonas ginsengisoli]
MADQAFEDRLENWGRYWRRSRVGYASSPTAIVCEQMAIAAGKTITDGYRELHPRPEIDEVDAQTIEWCWTKSSYRLDARVRAILKAHYVSSNDKRATCRALQIRLRSYDSFLLDAVSQFQQVVALLEGMGHNTVKTDRQPAKAV